MLSGYIFRHARLAVLVSNQHRKNHPLQISTVRAGPNTIRSTLSDYRRVVIVGMKISIEIGNGTALNSLGYPAALIATVAGSPRPYADVTGVHA